MRSVESPTLTVDPTQSGLLLVLRHRRAAERVLSHQINRLPELEILYIADMSHILTATMKMKTANIIVIVLKIL